MKASDGLHVSGIAIDGAEILILSHTHTDGEGENRGACHDVSNEVGLAGSDQSG